MPELPEIETIRRGLQGRILNTKIVQFGVLSAKSFRGEKAHVLGRKFVRIDRKGKALLMRLDDGMTIMAHMRMTGQMIVVGAGERFAAGHPDGNFVAEMPSKHTRVWFGFEDGSHLYFNDLRKFGFLALLDEKSLENDRFLRELGPEPWDMSEADFYEALQRHKSAPIKATLLNQKVVAGLGNIYVDEACHLTRIFPGTLTGKLSRAQSDVLLQNARKVMQDAIDAGGSTMKDYVRADGTRGNYLDKFARVFRRDGEACLTCGTTILKTRVAGRGTHYCPKCQPEQ